MSGFTPPYAPPASGPVSITSRAKPKMATTFSSMSSKEKPPVRIPRAHYIPVPKSRLLKKMLSLIQEDKERHRFEKFASLVGGLYHSDAQQITDSMKSDYIVLHPHYHGHNHLMDAKPSEEEEKSMEGRFFKQFFQMLKEANFVPISRAQAELAQEFSYLFTLPVNVDWDSLSPLKTYRDMLVDPKLWPVMKNLADLPDFSSHFFIFHRGVSIDRRHDFLWSMKIQLSLHLLSGWLSQTVRAWIARALGRSVAEGIERAGDAVNDSIRQSLGDNKSAVPPLSTPQPNSISEEDGDGTEITARERESSVSISEYDSQPPSPTSMSSRDSKDTLSASKDKSKSRFSWFKKADSGPHLFGTKSPADAAISGSSSALTEPTPKHKSRFIDRINLYDTYLKRSSTLSWFFSRVTIQEPAYERLVLVYRDSGYRKVSRTTLGHLFDPTTGVDAHESTVIGMADFIAEDERAAEQLEQAAKEKAAALLLASPRGSAVQLVPYAADGKQGTEASKGTEPANLKLDTRPHRRPSLTKLVVPPPGSPIAVEGSPDAAEVAAQRAKASLQKVSEPAVHIKYFKDIPMADMEVVYPEKNVSMDPADKLKMFITLLVGVIALLYQLFSHARAGYGYEFVMISLLLYAIETFYSFQSSLNEYATVVHETLYEKSLDHDLGVLVVLSDALEEQEFNTAMLAYFMLWKHGPTSSKQLKEDLCEPFLRQHWKCDVSFPVHDALSKLHKLKVLGAKKHKRKKTEGAPTSPQFQAAEDDIEALDPDVPFDWTLPNLYEVVRPKKAIDTLLKTWGRVFKEE